MLKSFKFQLGVKYHQTEADTIDELCRYFEASGIEYSTDCNGYEVIRFRQTFNKWTILYTSTKWKDLRLTGFGPEPHLLPDHGVIYVSGHVETDED